MGSFPGGESPYGLLDLSGNVWEWTRSLYDDYPYPDEGIVRSQREDLTAGDEKSRVLRGGAFYDDRNVRPLRVPLRVQSRLRGLLLRFSGGARPCISGLWKLWISGALITDQVRRTLKVRCTYHPS